MISVAIMINGNPIMARSAVKKGEHKRLKGKYKYAVDDGSEIIHDPKEGAVALAIRMLKNIDESAILKKGEFK